MNFGGDVIIVLVIHDVLEGAERRFSVLQSLSMVEETKHLTLVTWEDSYVMLISISVHLPNSWVEVAQLQQAMTCDGHGMSSW